MTFNLVNLVLIILKYVNCSTKNMLFKFPFLKIQMNYYQYFNITNQNINYMMTK